MGHLEVAKLDETFYSGNHDVNIASDTKRNEPIIFDIESSSVGETQNIQGEASPLLRSSPRLMKSLPRQKHVSISFDDNPATAADALMEIPEFSNDPNHLEIPMINKRLRKITEESRTSSTGMSRKSSWLQTLRNSVLVPNESHLSLISVARNIQHTGSQIKEKRADLVYLFLLIIYTFAGAFIFKYLDGEYDERMIEAYNTRCNSAHRNEALRAIQMNYCNENNGIKCFKKMRSYMEEIENCYIRWHEVNKLPSYSMNDFVNSLVYSFSVYTTIGWGNIAADTTACRIATVLYAIIGIPLFFAFAKEAGLYFRPIFINLFNKFEKWCNRKCCKNGSVVSLEDGEDDEAKNLTKQKRAKERASELYGDGPNLRVPEFEDRIIPKFEHQSSSLSMSGEDQLEERRRVFAAGVAVLLTYFLVNSLVLKMTTEFDLITSVYFSFTSVATIGFGDEFPNHPVVLLYNATFIAIGLVMFSMCYFILQEEIRTKASKASRKARKSFSKYSNVVIQQAKDQFSRRNSPQLIFVTEAGNQNSKLKKRRQSAPSLSNLAVQKK